ncbi:MAG: Rho termination factor N-terminal domain-containing protein [Rhodococcus sp. (in: high G+C Gram-positive bacteria)]
MPAEKSDEKKPDDKPQLKDQDLYEKLRDEGNSKEKAARISNAAANEGRGNVGKKGGKSPSYDEWTVVELTDRAKELGVEGYSKMKKDELIDALRNH